MMLSRLISFVILLWVCLYTGSYALWTWKKKNRIGSVMLFILAIAVIAVPIYAMYFKGD